MTPYELASLATQLFLADNPGTEATVQEVAKYFERAIELIDTARAYLKPVPDDRDTAIRRAVQLSVDHITAWMGQGTGSNFAKSMCEEIEHNVLTALKP